MQTLKGFYYTNFEKYCSKIYFAYFWAWSLPTKHQYSENENSSDAASFIFIEDASLTFRDAASFIVSEAASTTFIVLIGFDNQTQIEAFKRA